MIMRGEVVDENMNIIEVNERTQDLIQQLLMVWEKSVRETHLFLSDAEIENIRKYVPEILNWVEHLIIANDEEGHTVAFMGIENDVLEMLFIIPEQRGKGLGKDLLSLGNEKYGVKQLTVNEQNPQAIGFYEHLGFKVYKRTDNDEQGNPYPLLYMCLEK